MERKAVLGRGLSAIFSEDKVSKTNTSGGAIQELGVTQLVASSLQPRKLFNQEKIQLLAQSIQESGIIQPLVVRQHPQNPEKYEIIAGERRWLAAQKIGLKHVPVIIKTIDDQAALKAAIIENVQREDLNAIEEAEGYARLIKEYNYTQEMLAQEIGKSRSHIANTLRLLGLPDEVKGYLAEGKLTAGHARALLSSSDPLALAQRIMDKKLNVRQAEKLAAQPSQDLRPVDQDALYLEEKLAELTQAEASVKIQKNNVTLTLKFQNIQALDNLMRTLIKGQAEPSQAS